MLVCVSDRERERESVGMNVKIFKFRKTTNQSLRIEKDLLKDIEFIGTFSSQNS